MRLVQENRGDYPSLWATVESIASKIGCIPQTLLDWVKRAEVDSSQRDGLIASERERLKQLERENKELRRANEILKTACTFFARRSSTAVSKVKTIYRPASAAVRGRANLQHRTDCPVVLSATCRSAEATRTALPTRPAERAAQGR